MKILRESGYYRVLCLNQWLIAEWIVNMWYFPGIATGISESEITEVNEKIINPKPKTK
jgi:hypothetical protein